GLPHDLRAHVANASHRIRRRRSGAGRPAHGLAPAPGFPAALLLHRRRAGGLGRARGRRRGRHPAGRRDARARRGGVLPRAAHPPGVRGGAHRLRHRHHLPGAPLARPRRRRPQRDRQGRGDAAAGRVVARGGARRAGL
ncbi:MAG: hypothetical protein AVDCRST_MAG68-2636, partial [uncultured Gemmatimonadetes bacterium]